MQDLFESFIIGVIVSVSYFDAWFTLSRDEKGSDFKDKKGICSLLIKYEKAICWFAVNNWEKILLFLDKNALVKNNFF